MKKRLQAHGFTLAEILITLVIIGFVAALGVPMLGQQKVKTPMTPKDIHGTVECFYMNNVLYKYEADNVDNKNGTLTPVNEYCSMVVPVASRFVFQAIGAGGNGAGMGNATPGRPTFILAPSYTSTTVPVNGEIPINTGFLASMESEDVPDWVRNEWNQQWNQLQSPSQWPSFTINSPIGASGNPVCQPRRVNCDLYIDGKCIQIPGGCLDLCTVGLDTCPERCKFYVKANGGDSGLGAEYTVNSRVYYSPNGAKDNISFNLSTEQATLNIGSDKSVTLKASGEGASARVSGEQGINGANGQDFIMPGSMQGQNNYVSINGDVRVMGRSTTRKSPGGQGCSSLRVDAIYGSIAANSSIRYESQSLAIRANFGVAGTPGTTELKMIENIPTGIEIRLYPAKNNDTEYSKIKIRNRHTGLWEDFMVASSGQSGARYNGLVLPYEESDFPFPKSYYPDAFESQMPSRGLWVASVNGYRSYLAGIAAEPGRSGYGAFPVITSVTGIARHKINGVYTSSEVLRPMESDKASITCPNGLDSVQDSIIAGRNACYSTAGNPGVVVVTW